MPRTWPRRTRADLDARCTTQTVGANVKHNLLSLAIVLAITRINRAFVPYTYR